MAAAGGVQAIRGWVAGRLCQPWVGRAVAVASRGRVPSLRFRDLRVHIDPALVTPETVAMLFWGIYESAELRFVRRYLRPDLDTVELGASIGAVSQAIARRQAPGRRLICVEADPRLLPLLRRNLAEAGRSEVNVVHAAVDYESQGSRASFVVGATNVGGRTVAAAGGGGAGEPESLPVPTCTLSALLAAHGIGDYALVSDVEGAEAGFVYADGPALARCRQIVIELHDAAFGDRRESPATLREALVSRHGFRVRAERGPVAVFERP